MKRVAAEVAVIKKAKITDYFKVKEQVKVVEKATIEEAVKKVSVDNTSSVGLNHSEFKQQFIKKLTADQLSLLQLEINTLEDSWFEAIHTELTKPYFLSLKRFLNQQRQSHKIFPPEEDVYSWSRLTPLHSVKCIILGQDPYHNDNQAHGLAFSVKEPTPPPPSLRNMYKALKLDYPQFEAPRTGDLTHWAQQGVLLLNACLTVRAHEANSHAKKGWEQFTESVLKVALAQQKELVLLLWGTPAQNRVKNMSLKKHHVLKCVHPSPLSASRGFFEAQHFKKCNDWLKEQGQTPIDWALEKGNVIDY
jgi:uracil-DNA glycosylase